MLQAKLPFLRADPRFLLGLAPALPQYFLQKSFVDDSLDKRWCPTPNCGLAVDTRNASSKFVCCASVRAIRVSRRPARCALPSLLFTLSALGRSL